MIDVLRDPVWQFIGALISIIAIVITIITFLIQRNRKQISYEIVLDFPILSIDEVFQIVSNGRIIEDARFAILRIWNSGNVPIPPSDYVEPIAFSFGKNAEIIDAKILETSPANLRALFKQNSDQLVLKPLLLNRKESIKLAILLSGKYDKVYSDARIIGVNLIQKSNTNKQRSFLKAFVLNLAVFLLLFCNLNTLFIIITKTYYPSVFIYIKTSIINFLPHSSSFDFLSNVTTIIVMIVNIILFIIYFKILVVISINKILDYWF